MHQEASSNCFPFAALNATPEKEYLSTTTVIPSLSLRSSSSLHQIRVRSQPDLSGNARGDPSNLCGKSHGKTTALSFSRILTILFLRGWRFENILCDHVRKVGSLKQCEGRMGSLLALDCRVQGGRYLFSQRLAANKRWTALLSSSLEFVRYALSIWPIVVVRSGKFQSSADT